MAVYDLEEQEQIETLKAWWRQHGSLITWVVSLVAAAVVAWQGWNFYQNRQSAEASVLFTALEQAAAKNDAARVRTLAGELTEKYGRTAYASLGTLVAAKLSFEAGDGKTARAQLAWVAEHGKDELADIARLRLAGVLLDAKEYDAARQALAGKPAEAFAAAYAELRGDVEVAAGKPEAARAAYQEALAALGKDGGQGPVAQLLHQKLDALGGEAKASAAGEGKS